MMHLLLSIVLVLGFLENAACADRATAFNIKSVSCSENSASLASASCGYNGGEPCRMGDQVSASGTYTVGSSVPKEVEVCAKVQVIGIKVYDCGCKNVNVCDYLEDCSNDSDYIESGSYTYAIDRKIPGDSKWIGSGYGFGFVFTAYDGGSKVESCKVVVKASTVRSSSALVALASLCTAAAAVYCRRRRRTATIDLEKEEERAIQTDFVEMSKSGVSV